MVAGFLTRAQVMDVEGVLAVGATVIGRSRPLQVSALSICEIRSQLEELT